MKPGFWFLVAAIAAWVLTITPRSATPKFFPDDPIWADDDTALDASKVGTIEDTNGYDFVINTFGRMGERRDVRALNVNTVDVRGATVPLGVHTLNLNNTVTGVAANGASASITGTGSGVAGVKR